MSIEHGKKIYKLLIMFSQKELISFYYTLD